MQQIKIILRYIHNISDFIEFINSNRLHILKMFNKSKDEPIIVTDFFNLDNEFKRKMDKSFFITSYSIKEFQIENNNQFILLFNPEYLLTSQNSTLNIIIRKYIYGYIFDNISYKNITYTPLHTNYLKNSNFISFNNEFNKFEIMQLLEASFLSKFTDMTKFLFISLDLESFDEELIKYFLKLKWKDASEFIINFIIRELSGIKSYEIMFKIIEPLSKNKNAISNLNFSSIILELNKKIIEILTKNNEISKENVDILSKIIYLSDKFKIAENLLINLCEVMNSQDLKETLKNTFKNYKINNFLFCNNLIKILINKKQMDFIPYLIYNKQIDKIIYIFDSYLIQYEDILSEEDSINYLLLKTLKENNFFNLYYSTLFSIKTLYNLENILTKIIYLENIDEIFALYKNIEKFELFGINGNSENGKIIFQKKYKNISSIILNCKECLKSINELNLEFPNWKFNFITFGKTIGELMKQKNVIYSLKEDLIKLKKYLDNNFIFKYIGKYLEEKKEKNDIKKKNIIIDEEKNEKFILFEKILYIFNPDKLNEIDSDLILSIFPHFFSLNDLEKFEEIKNLINCYDIYKKTEKFIFGNIKEQNEKEISF